MCCENWDFYNSSCMWERMERIFSYEGEKEVSKISWEQEGCFEEKG